MSVLPDTTAPAESLSGLLLDGGWRVLDLIEKGPEATGGFFSRQYRVQSEDGRVAFLKALDITRALEDSPDPARALEALTTAFNYERDVLGHCKKKNLSRVVTVLEDGKIRVRPGVDGVVQYLIFEHAESDIRERMNRANAIDNFLRLEVLHHVATGLHQLHGIEIAHQDLKPSNVLLFQNGSKIGDLGCASRKGSSNPREEAHIIGDIQYAPPELLYHAVPVEWNERRFACDLYLLASMVVYLFSGAALTPLLVFEIPDEMRPSNWTGTFQDVLPFVRKAFDLAVKRFTVYVSDPLLVPELDQTVRQLGDPEPLLRGHPLNRARSSQNQYSLERYVTRFDLLAKRARLRS